MFIINKDMYGAWGTGEENMNNKKIYMLKIHKKDIEQQMRKYIIKNFFNQIKNATFHSTDFRI